MLGTTNSGIVQEIYSPYASATGMLIHIDGKFTTEKVKSSVFVLNRRLLSISMCGSRCEADQSVSEISFISSSIG